MKQLTLVEHVREWEECEKCQIGKWAYRHVFFFRNYKTTKCDLLFIGEAPGPVEDFLGKPFVGPAGKFLKEEIGTTPINYMFTNIIACQPIDKKGGPFRTPSEHEILACTPRLEQFLDITTPSVVCLLGKVAYWNYPPDYFIDNMFDLEHPSFILRNGGINAPEYPAWKKELERIIDFAENI